MDHRYTVTVTLLCYEGQDACKIVSDLPLPPKFEKRTAAGWVSHLTSKPNLAENLSMCRILSL